MSPTGSLFISPTELNPRVINSIRYVCSTWRIQGYETEDLISEATLAVLQQAHKYNNQKYAVQTWTSLVARRRLQRLKNKAEKSVETVSLETVSPAHFRSVYDTETVAEPPAAVYPSEEHVPSPRTLEFLRTLQENAYLTATEKAVLQDYLEDEPATETADKLELTVGSIIRIRKNILTRLKEIFKDYEV